MPVVPSKSKEKIAFYQARATSWAANAVDIGLTKPVTDAVDAKVLTAVEALAAQEEALVAAKDATSALNDAVKALGIEGAAAIKMIRAKAESTGDLTVYTKASIPAPAKPTRNKTPGTPTQFAATIAGNGGIDLTWKCKHPVGVSGVIYQVYRRLNNTGPFVSLGGTGERKFTDSTLPVGSTQIQYQIQAIRSSAVGGWGTFLVMFGLNSGVTVQEQSVKMAA